MPGGSVSGGPGAEEAPNGERAADRRPAPLTLPGIDRRSLPSYWLTERAHWAILSGFIVLAGFSLVISVVVIVDRSVATTGVTEPAVVWPVRALESGVVHAFQTRTGATVARGDVVVLLDDLASRGQIEEVSLELAEREADFDRFARVLPATIREQRERQVALDNAVTRANALLRERVVQVTGSAAVDSVIASYRPGSLTQIDLALADAKAADAERRAGLAALDRTGADSLDLVRRQLELRRLRIRLRDLRTQVRRLTVRAPSSGVVLTDGLEQRRGQLVHQGDLLLEIAESSEWRVRLHVREREVHDIRPEQRVSVEIPALEQLDGRQLQGRVLSVAPEASSPASSVPGEMAASAGSGFRVWVTLDRLDLERLGPGALRRGYSVRARVITQRGSIAALLGRDLREWWNAHRWW